MLFYAAISQMDSELREGLLSISQTPPLLTHAVFYGTAMEKSGNVLFFYWGKEFFSKNTLFTVLINSVSS